MRIGIFGGTFDPVHNEHVELAKVALKELQLDRLYVMPTYLSPFKKNERVTAAGERLDMARLAFEPLGENVVVSDYEVLKGGSSYTFETVRHVKGLFPRDQLFLIVGGDSLTAFKTWKNPEIIMQNADLAVADRRLNFTALDQERKYFIRRFGKPFIKLDYEGSNLSATKIRLLASFGLPLTGLVPEAVERYVVEQGLYQTNPYADYLKTALKPERLIHTVGVVTAALKKARELPLNPEKVAVAATLHDMAKYVDPETVEGFVYKGIPSQVVHAYLGAYLAERDMKITDQDVLDAIRYHTTAKAAMSTLGKLIFTADMIEDGRTYDGVERLREMFYTKPLDEVFTECLKEEVEHLKQKGYEPFTETVNAYNYYVKNKENRV